MVYDSTVGSVLVAVNAMANGSAEEMQALYALYRENVGKLNIQAYSVPNWQHEKIRVGYMRDLEKLYQDLIKDKWR